MLSLKLSFSEKSSKSGLNVRKVSNYARRQPGNTIIPLASSGYGHNAQAINAREVDANSSMSLNVNPSPICGHRHCRGVADDSW
jgi:hypothetical protein